MEIDKMEIGKKIRDWLEPREKRRRNIYKLVPKVLNKLFPVPIEALKWTRVVWFVKDRDEQGEDWKHRAPCIYPKDTSLNEDSFRKYFSQEAETVSIWREEFFVELTDRVSNHIKSFCFRLHKEQDIEGIKDKLLSRLDYYGVEYLIHRFIDEIRIWIFCDTSVWLAGLFIKKILDEVNLLGCVRPDIFPFNNPVRVPVLSSAGLVEFRGKIENDSIFIMESILECKPVSEMQMLAALQKPVEHKSY